MSMIIKDYELSIWDCSQNKEKKVAIFGSPEIFSNAKAQEVTLTRNVNGTKTLSFYLYYEYIDDDGIRKINPYYNLLNTDTKLKLKWKEKWYEFVIKSISEVTENKKITYVAEDAFITELSKRGFEVELSTELENNQGTIYDLGNSILKKSDWKINKEKSKVKPQIIKDVLVRLKVTKTFSADNVAELDEDDLLIKNSTTKEKILKGKEIYCFYSTLKKKDPFFQFYYLEGENYEFDDDGFLFNAPLYSINDCEYSNETPKNTQKKGVTIYRGKRLVKTQKSYYNSKIGNYVQVYKNEENSKEVLGYVETEYLTDNYVTNLVTNSTDFISDIGWYSCDENELKLTSYPDESALLELISKNTEIETIPYIGFNFSKIDQYQFYNTGMEDNKKIFSKGLHKGQKFVIKLDFSYSKSDTLNKLPSSSKFDKKTKNPYSCFKIALASYSYDSNGKVVIDKKFFETDLKGGGEDSFKKDGQYYTAFCTNNVTISKNKLLETNLGFFIAFETTSSSSITNKNIKDYYFYIKDCQIFEYKQKSNTSYYTPEDSVNGMAKVVYNYFYSNQDYETAEDIEFLSQSYNPKNYSKVYYDNFIQIRTIEGKESNYFNLLQNLAETFECWIDFLVEHDELGYLKLDSSGFPKKEIAFKPFLGKKNWAGFRKGINLKHITREIDNSQIITKTIVKPNSNEFAPYGFCTIAYSEDNPSGESFIYDFSFYENKKLINKNILNSRLYDNNGLYSNLKTKNKKLQELSDELTANSLELIHLNSEKQIIEAQINELSEEVAIAKKDFKIYSGYSYKEFLKEGIENQTDLLELSNVGSTLIVISSNTKKISQEKEKLKIVKNQYEEKMIKQAKLEREINDLKEEKEKLIFDFEKNYSSYIREGVWISEEYTDHDLYYADAKAVASTSANPQITYTIDVIDISCLQEFFNYDFDLGDKTYIIDPDFFGYIEIDDLKTPKRQEVVITEIKEVLDSPENNKITVQNYKTQFEDLFQRITATTQQLKLNEGVYNRAAKSFGYNGLVGGVAEASLNDGGFNLENSSVQWTEEGIIVSDIVNNQPALKLANGNLSISQNNEAAWASIITPKGINANYIYTGQLDAGVINIVSELKKDENDNLEYAITMDKDGLSMYSYSGQKIPRLRLGKLLENNSSTAEKEELYGLQLYNSSGQQTFRTDSNGDITMTGTIYAKDGSFSGTISAKQGVIGGWTIDDAALTHKTLGVIDSIITTQKLDARYTVNSFTTDDWRLIFGLNGIKGNFGVNSSGNLFANGVDIKDGNINFGDIFKITSGKDENGDGDTLSYGLNIKLSKENEDKEVVIESDDRVIGIREKVRDDNGNVITDENGQDKWTWKTILGDLTNATLGKDKLSDLGLTGYGLCTENGLFSGTIIATNGEIGSWKILENTLWNSLDANSTFNMNGISLGAEFSETLVFEGNKNSDYDFTFGFGDYDNVNNEILEIFPHIDVDGGALFGKIQFKIVEVEENGIREPVEIEKIESSYTKKVFFPGASKIEDINLVEENCSIFIEAINYFFKYKIENINEIIINYKSHKLELKENDPKDALAEEGLLVEFGFSNKFLENLKTIFNNNIELFKDNWLDYPYNNSYFHLELTLNIITEQFGWFRYNGGFVDTEDSEGSTFYFRVPKSKYFENGLITSYKDYMTYRMYQRSFSSIEELSNPAFNLIKYFTISKINKAYNKIKRKSERVLGSRFQVFKEGENVFSIDNYGHLFFTDGNKEKPIFDIHSYIETPNNEITSKEITFSNSRQLLTSKTIAEFYLIGDIKFSDEPSIWNLYHSYDNILNSEKLTTEGKIQLKAIDRFNIENKATNLWYKEETDAPFSYKTATNKWVFETKFEEDSSSSSFYPMNSSNLGTLENPWGDLYLKHYGKIFSFTKEGKKVQLLYVSSGNNITIGYKEKDKNVPNDTNLHTGDIGLYAQTVNVKNDLSVVGNLTASKINEIKPYYGPGDSIIFDNNFVWTGYLSTGRNTIYFSIPLDKPLLPNTEVNLSGAIQMRGHGNSGGGYIINLNRANASTSPTSAFTTGETGVTFTYQEKNGYLIVKVTSTATLTKYSQLGDSTATYETINNTPLAICPTSSTKLTLTFTKASS